MIEARVKLALSSCTQPALGIVERLPESILILTHTYHTVKMIGNSSLCYSLDPSTLAGNSQEWWHTKNKLIFLPVCFVLIYNL